MCSYWSINPSVPFNFCFTSSKFLNSSYNNQKIDILPSQAINWDIQSSKRQSTKMLFFDLLAGLELKTTINIAWWHNLSPTLKHFSSRTQKKAHKLHEQLAHQRWTLGHNFTGCRKNWRENAPKQKHVDIHISPINSAAKVHVSNRIQLEIHRNWKKTQRNSRTKHANDFIVESFVNNWTFLSPVLLRQFVVTQPTIEETWKKKERWKTEPNIAE